MPKKKQPKLSETNKHKVQFKFYSPEAKEVYLAGSFNKWNPIKKKMKQNQKGEWLTRIILAEGEHHYKYIVDGQWINDPGAARYVDDGLGVLNSVRIV